MENYEVTPQLCTIILYTINNESLAWLRFGNLANLPLIFADVLDKFVKLYAAKFMAKQFCKTLATPNFYCLWYIYQK